MRRKDERIWFRRCAAICWRMLQRYCRDGENWQKETKYVLAVVPGDRKVDLNAIKHYTKAPTSLHLRRSPRIIGCAKHNFTLSFNRFTRNVDPSMLEAAGICFNATRLDQSMATEGLSAAAICVWRRLSHVDLGAVLKPPFGNNRGTENSTSTVRRACRKVL